ncbi:MAG: PAS domain-containing protein [Kiritimatiellae bacterium]|nr:PAS domain-containing protein [Kiritimatiellia bacterium]
MRIDITPDALKELRQIASKPDARKMRRRPRVIKTSQDTQAGLEASKYDQLLQSIYDAAIVTDLEGHIKDVNVRAMEFFLYDVEEFRQVKMLDIIAGADESLLESIRGNLQNERFALIQAYCVRKDQTFFPAEIAVNILRFADMRMCFFIRDITLRKQAEEMLRTEHNAIQNSGNGIAIADVDGMLEYVNPALVKLCGATEAEELVGRDVSTLMKDEAAARAMVRSVLGEEQAWSGEMIIKKRNSGILDVQVSAACNRDSDGEIVGMVLSFVDISDRKRAEEAMKQAERQRAMLASLGAACHYLGQPATVIMTNLELMKRMEAVVNDEFKELLRASIEASEAVADILHKLNMVDEYRTTQYIEGRDDPNSPTNRILEI